jgi:hypothetical protein
VGEAVLGGTPRGVWGAIAIAVAAAGLALAATPARATTDRVDYSDQANPICASANKQMVQLYETFEAEIQRLDRAHPKSRKKARRLYKRFERLYEQLPFQYIAIYHAELAQLKAIAAPPGYEDVVGRWLGTREEILALYVQYVQIDQELENSPGLGTHPSRKAIKRRQKRRANLHRLESQIEDKLLVDTEVDLELGAKLGAAYCVTGADGVIDQVVFGGSD